MGHVILGRAVCLRRNFAAFKFVNRLDETDRQRVINIGEMCVRQLDFKPCDLDYPAADELIDNVWLFGGSESEKKAFYSAAVRLVLCEGDHINIRSHSWEDDLGTLYAECKAVEAEFAKRFELAFDPNLGYLTASLDNTGNALEAGVLVHLPCLRENEKFEKIAKELEDRYFSLKKLVDIDDSACAFYILSNRLNLGITEAEALEMTEAEARRLEEIELEAQKDCLKDDPDELKDIALRAEAVLSYAHLMDFDELAEMYSDYRMGILTGQLEGNVDEADEFVLSVSPRALFEEYGEMDEREEELLRARLCREFFGNLCAFE